jgi:maleate isomerase
MSYSNYRGTVGLIRPTMRPGVLEDLVRALPEGICLIPVFNDVRGAQEEFESAIPLYRARAEEIAKHDVDLIFLSGAPPFMVIGHERERELMATWEKELGVPVVTSAVNQIEALAALGVTRFYGATYFPDTLNDVFAAYFEGAGFEPLAMEGLTDVPFTRVQEISSHVVYAAIKKGIARCPAAEAIYMLGPAWRTLDIIEPLEQDLGIPVVHAIPAQSWLIQKRLRVRQPMTGLGRLLAEMP